MKLLKNNKVTWWNELRQRQETGIVDRVLKDGYAIKSEGKEFYLHRMAKFEKI